jgi:hypothetical protein
LPAAITRLNWRTKHFRRVTCFFSIQSHLIQTATKDKILNAIGSFFTNVYIIVKLVKQMLPKNFPVYFFTL